MRVLGMMSGTSMDAIDVALLELDADAADPELLRGELLHHEEIPWPADLRERMLDVLPPARSDVGTWCLLHAEAGDALGHAAARVLAAHGGADLVASHGQTLFHAPPRGSAMGATLQIGDPARIHAATSLPVIADLRAADMARGGQGAPLVPLLDELLLGERPSVVVNIGGIANASRIGDGRGTLAGDTGPGNALLDAAVRAHSDGALSCDEDGRLARAGTCDDALLAALLADPFLSLPFPRSTGREHYDGRYVERTAAAAGVPLPPRIEDLLATLVELSARSIASEVRRLAAPTADGRPAAERVIASGGGMANPVLRARLAELLAPLPLLEAEDAIGLPGDAKEAVLVALLGWLSAHGLPGTLPADPGAPDGPAATGARHVTVLGTLTPPAAALPEREGLRSPRRLRITPSAGTDRTPRPDLGERPAP